MKKRKNLIAVIILIAIVIVVFMVFQKGEKPNTLGSYSLGSIEPINPSVIS